MFRNSVCFSGSLRRVLKQICRPINSTVIILICFMSCWRIQGGAAKVRPTYGYLPPQFRLSVVCLSSVTFVHLTQRVDTFGNVSMPHCTVTIRKPPRKILRRSAQGNPSVGESARVVAKYRDIGHVEDYNLGNGARYGLGYKYWLIGTYTRRIQCYHSGPSRVIPNKGSGPPISGTCLYLWS